MRAYEFNTRTPLALDRHRICVIDDIAVVRTSPPLTPFASSLIAKTGVAGGRSGNGCAGAAASERRESTPGMIERCVVVQRQPDGYGLTVTGDHPVYVYTVRPDGAAFIAGVRQGDRILKVNGMPVTSSNHVEVVRMISGGQNVALTLLGKPPEPLEIQPENEYARPDNFKDFKSCDHLNLQKSVFGAAISNAAEERPFNRKEMIHRMLEDEKRHIENLRVSEEKKEKLEQALSRVERLKSQLHIRGGGRESPWTGRSSASQELLSADAIEDEEDMAPVSRAPPPPPLPPPPQPLHFRPDELDGNAPFTNMETLKTHPAHVTCFLDYLIMHGNPSSLFFYLITDSFCKEPGSVKDLRRWAFEIFSTFLVPNGPMLLPNSDPSIINPIDKMLNNTAHSVADSDMRDLKEIFKVARVRALADISDQLTDYRQKREMGFGSTGDLSFLARTSRTDEEKAFAERKLMHQLEAQFGCSGPSSSSSSHALAAAASSSYTSNGPSVNNSTNNITTADYESCDPRKQASISSIATLVKIVFSMKPSSSAWDRLLDKCPTFLQKEKSGGKFKTKTGTPKRNLQIKGHVFALNPVNVVHYCYQCRNAIWGIQATGYFCLNCEVVLHKQCTAHLAEECYAATQKSRHKTKRNQHLKGSVGTSSTTLANMHAMAADDDEEGGGGHGRGRGGERGERPAPGVKSTSSDSGIAVELNNHLHYGHVARSHSMKSRLSQMTNSTSQSGDDSLRVLPRSARGALSWGDNGMLQPADEVSEDGSRTPRSTTSIHSASNRNRSVESGGRNRLPLDLQSNSGCSVASQDEEVLNMARVIIEQPDSDIDIETEVPSLDSIIGWDVVRHLKPKEKKRQEVINELFHTEQTHVRNLKILQKVFFEPMKKNATVTPDVLELVFANIEEILDIHRDMCKKMKEARERWRLDATLKGQFGDIGPLMSELFEGTAGERLKSATSEFCQHMQHALDYLRSRYKRDGKDPFVRFVASVEAHPICRKLQLKDMLPVEMQRLVKYPMLLETVAKYTQEDSEEQERLLGVVTAAKRILSAVNTAKRNYENKHRLEELNKVLDTNAFDREYSRDGRPPASKDLLTSQLIHDGPLAVRFTKGKTIDMHIVLLADKLILLTRHSDGTKLLLKNLDTGKEKMKPVLTLNPLRVHEKVNDPRSFLLYSELQPKGHFCEFIAPTSTDRKTWLKLMNEQFEYARNLPTQGIEKFTFDQMGGSGDGEDGDKDSLMLPTQPHCQSLSPMHSFKSSKSNISIFSMASRATNFSDQSMSSKSSGSGGSLSLRTKSAVQVLTHPRLVHANEITVLQPTVLEHAQPVLTPAERLRRDDQLIFQALLDKHLILSQLLPGEKTISPDELEKMTEMMSSLAVSDLKQRDPREVAMSAIVHGNRLLESITKGMTAQKEADDAVEAAGGSNLSQLDAIPSVPCYQLITIAAPLMNHLKALSQVVQFQQNELNNVRAQLGHLKVAELGGAAAADRSVSEETLTDGLPGGADGLYAGRTSRAPSIPHCPPPPL